jgi:chaperonin cofactor prefoldin
MRRETGEKIIAAMKRMDAVLEELDIASWEIEDIDGKSKILREISKYRS